MRVLSVVTCALFALMRPAGPAVADDVDQCIAGSVILPLLGGRTDAPIISVRVDGHDAAMYLSPGWSDVFVCNPADRSVEFSDRGRDSMVDSNGYHLVPATNIAIDELTVAGTTLHTLSAVLLHGETRQMALLRKCECGIHGMNLVW